MARHEFGIMDIAPRSGEEYIDYEPELYNCISVDDEIVERIDWKIKDVKCFWHTVDRPQKGLAYCGITLIPPESMVEIITALGEEEEVLPLKYLLQKAERENKFVIHFGL